MYTVGKGPKFIKNASDAGVKGVINNNGQLEITIFSAVKPGRGTRKVFRDGARLSENELRKAVGMFAAMAAERQNRLWGDKHDPKDAIRKADDVLRKLMLDHRPVAAIGMFTTYAPDQIGGPAITERTSRASEDDPITRDALKGKDWSD